MKIREIYQRQRITEESWADIAKAAYAGATGQKDIFGKEQENQYNAEIEKSKAGQDWLVKNFVSRANSVRPPNPEKYREIAKQLLDQLMSNQTGGFKNLLMTMGLKNRPTTDIDSFINDIKIKFGNDLRSLPELSRVLDNLGRTYDDILVKASEHHQTGSQQPVIIKDPSGTEFQYNNKDKTWSASGNIISDPETIQRLNQFLKSPIDPALQRLMAGFSAIWYNLPNIMKDAINRSIQSARYGERWIDVGGGVEIKPESNLDRRIAARFNDEVFNLQNNKWRDSLNSEAPENIQAYLNNALQIAQLKQKTPLVKTTAAPNTAAMGLKTTGSAK